MAEPDGAARHPSHATPPLEWPPWAVLAEPRRAHVLRVWELLHRWGRELAVSAPELSRWRLAVVLHDAVKDAPLERLRALAPDAWDEDALRHGPAAAELAARSGVTDQGVLDAVRYHSVGYRDWDDAGRMLYVADYLDPGRPFEREARAALVARMPAERAEVLCVVAGRRIRRQIARGWPLAPETVSFWNAVRCAD